MLTKTISFSHVFVCHHSLSTLVLVLVLGFISFYQAELLAVESLLVVQRLLITAGGENIKLLEYPIPAAPAPRPSATKTVTWHPMWPHRGIIDPLVSKRPGQKIPDLSGPHVPD